MATSKKSRSWMLTINNPTIDDDMEIESDNPRYRIYQLEVGENETPHYQMFLYYDTPRSIKKIRSLYTRAHAEICNNISACIAYCKKSDTRIDGPWEEGEPPSQGKRSDLVAVINDITEGKDIVALCKDHPIPMMKYSRGIQFVQNMLMFKDRIDAPKVYWIWGATGTGKTSHVFKKWAVDEIYVKDHTQWWDGYNQQKVILIDDFDGRWPYRDFLRLLDRYPYRGQVKGSYICINSPYIYITCEFPPTEIFKIEFGDKEEKENHINQVLRRLTKIIHLEKK